MQEKLKESTVKSSFPSKLKKSPRTLLRRLVVPTGIEPVFKV